MTREEVAQKIENLRNMTVDRGCTENEAKIALKLLNAFMKEYNLSLTEAEILTTEYIGMELEGEKRQEIHTLINDIGHYCDVEHWYSTEADKYIYYFFGTKQDSLNAQYLFIMLNNAVRNELKKFRKQHNKKKDADLDESFIRGICFRLGERLRDMKQAEVVDETTGCEYALVVRTKKDKIKELLIEAGIEPEPVSDTFMVSMNAFSEGYEKGNKIQINKGVEGDTPIERKQLR